MNTQQISFNQFGKTFQEKIVQALIVDKKWAQHMSEIIDVEYFDLEYLKYLTEKYFAYFYKYKDFPTLPLLITIVRDDFKSNNNTALCDQVIAYIHRIKSNPDVSDLSFVKDKTFDFCRRQAFKGALEEAIDLVLVDKYDDVIHRMKKAITVGVPFSVGHDLFEDLDKRFLTTTRSPVATGLTKLDSKHILNGGLGKGELGVICAPTGVGKSHFLTMLGANGLRNKKNVLHYTFELSEVITGIRYDSNLCNMSSTDVPFSKKDIQEKYQKMTPNLGRIFIKEYPAGYATINTLKAHLDKLQLTKDFIPDIILIDYADIMRSTRKYDSLRHELKLIYEELRSWATEIGIPIWTASQINREGSNHDVIELKNISEAYGKAMVADCVLSLSRKLADKSNDTGRLYVAKNRAGRDGMVWTVNIDTAKSKFEIMSEYSSIDAAQEESGNDMEKMLKNKWRQLRDDPVVDLKKVINS